MTRHVLARRRLFSWALAGLALPAVIAPMRGARAADAAAAFIQELGDEVVRVLRQGDLHGADRRAVLQDLLQTATDMELVGRLVLGRAWRTASEEQLEEYLQLFRGYALQTLIDRLNAYDYDGETFEITGGRTVDERDAVVTTVIRSPGHQPFRVEWRVRETGSRHAIIDVVIEGVSLVVSQRSEFAAVIGRSGMDGLLAELRQRIADSPDAA